LRVEGLSHMNTPELVKRLRRLQCKYGA